MTAGTLIYGALRLIGQLKRAGQGASTSELTDGLAVLNNVLDNWNTERLNIFSIGHSNYPLTTGQQVYTIGPGGQINAPRPVKIVSAAVQVPVAGGSGSFSQDLTLLDQTKWRAIFQRSAYSEFPQSMYCDYAFPLASIYLWPVPVFTTGVTIDLETWTALLLFADLTTAVNFPPGYARALEYALAVDLGPRFGLPIPPAVMQGADESKAALRALNAGMPATDSITAPANATPGALKQ